MRVAVVGNLPFDVAFAADDAFVLAWIIAQGENAGQEFDWDQQKWVPQR